MACLLLGNINPDDQCKLAVFRVVALVTFSMLLARILVPFARALEICVLSRIRGLQGLS